MLNETFSVIFKVELGFEKLRWCFSSRSFLQDRDMCGGLNFTTAMNGTRIISLVVCSALYCKRQLRIMHLHAEMKSFCGMTAEQNHNSPSRTQRLKHSFSFPLHFVTILKILKKNFNFWILAPKNSIFYNFFRDFLF